MRWAPGRLLFFEIHSVSSWVRLYVSVSSNEDDVLCIDVCRDGRLRTLLLNFGAAWMSEEGIQPKCTRLA